MRDLPDGWSIAGTGDFNGDGISDILLRDSLGNTTDWLGQAGGNGFADNSQNVYIGTGTMWHVAGTGDFNGSGADDIIWQSDDGVVRDWLGQLNATFVGNTDKVNITTGTDWHVLGTGDFNGDGRSDVLWQNDNGTVRDWLGQADGSFVGNIDHVNILTGTDWHVLGTGDFNGDGRDDILWQHDNGTIREWLGQADGSFVSNNDILNFIPAATSHVVGIGDFDGNGRDDLLWRDDDGRINIWLGQVEGWFLDNGAIASQPVSTDLQIAGVGDFNGDGRADVLFRTGGTLETWVGAANGAILSPMEKLWQEAVANVGEFVDDIIDSLADPTGSSGGETGTSLTGYAAIFGPSFPNVNSGAHDTYRGHSYTISFFDPWLVSGSSDTGGSGSISELDAANGSYIFDMNGIALVASWYAGSPPPATSSDSIVITGTRDSSDVFTATGYFQFNPVESGFDFNDGHGGGSSGRSGVPYTPAGNAWANAHINLIGTTPADVHAWNVMHDDLAKFFDWASANPNALIQIGNGTTVTASTALADFNQVAINIQSTGGGPNGGITTPNSSGGATITFSPENSNLSSGHAQYGDSIYNYALFHELGHALDNANAQSLYNSLDSEAYANSAGRSMENYLGIPLTNFPNATPPGGGYK